MPINETCYHAAGKDRTVVTVSQALAIRVKTRRFIGECLNPKCAGRIIVHKESKSGRAAHFQHAEPANEKCPLARPYRPIA
jgi:hypothetical protein